MDQFGVVRTRNKTTNGSGQSEDFVNLTNSEMRTGKNRNTVLSNAPDSEVDNETTSRQRIKARISTSTKLPGIDMVTPPLVTPLVDNGIEEALTNIVGSIGEQNEQMSLRMSELERAVHVERESLREEINRNLNKSRLRVNFNEQQNSRRTYGSTRKRGSLSGYATGDNRTRGPNNRGSSTSSRQTSNERPTQDTYATGRCDSRNRSHASQGRNNLSDSDMRENPNPEPLSGGNDTQAGHSRDATSRPQPLNL